MAKAEDDPLGKLLKKLNRLKKGLIMLELKVRVFGLQPLMSHFTLI